MDNLTPEQFFVVAEVVRATAAELAELPTDPATWNAVLTRSQVDVLKQSADLLWWFVHHNTTDQGAKQ